MPGSARPFIWNLPLGSTSIASTTTTPDVGLGAAGCDGTAMGLSGVIIAMTGRSFGATATATLCLDVTCLPSGSLDRNVRP